MNLGKYELQGVLGHGAAGTVYAAWDPVIARRVAIKTIRMPGGEDAETQAALGRFRREAQAAGRLVHPNIVGIHDVGETSDVAYIVMELVDGMALREVLRKRGRLPADEVMRLADQILAALEYSHAHGVVHRDIKPGNILLTAEQQVKIADFGIARIEGGGHTQTGLTLGTPAYMAPEQWRNAPVDARADVFAVGALLYHLLTGTRPFEADSPAAIMHKALALDPPPASTLVAGLPPALDNVLRTAMAKDPGVRYASAEAFRLALQQANAAIAEETVVSRPPTPPRRRRWGLVSLLLALAVGGSALLLVRPHPAPPPPPAPVLPSPQVRFASLIAHTSCVLLAGQADAAHASVIGLGGTAGLAAIHAAFDRIAGPGGQLFARAIPAEPGYCQALDILREAAPPFGSAQPVLGLRVPSGHADGALRDGEPVTLEITMADFAGWMQVDYLTGDGMVFHMLPRRAGDQAMPAHRYQPGRPFTLFEPEGAFRGWVVGEPYGTDLILVTVSDRPLFDAPRPDDERAEDYLPALRAALATPSRRTAWAVAVGTTGK